MNETEERWRREDRTRVAGGALGFVPTIALVVMFPPTATTPAWLPAWSIVASLVGVAFVFLGVLAAHAFTLRR